jgi:hypothetical protein
MSMSRLGVVVLVSLVFAAPAFAERPRSVIVPQDFAPEDIKQGAAPYNKIYLNPCLPNGCTITPGTSNSINNRWQIGTTRTLTKFPYSDAVWQQVVSCMKDTFSPYVVEITTTDPAPANHFEIMIAGRPTDLGMSSGIGGVAPGGAPCNSYINNALVFDFAAVWGTATECDAACVEDICSTAAQEIGHAWGMDHVTENKDPMTYFGYTGRRYFQNTAAPCGSDCVNGESPFGQTCTGTNQQLHNCVPCGGATQNSYNVIKALFGLGPGTPPTVKIISPKLGASVEPGFAVSAEPMDDSGMVQMVELRVDGQLIGSLTKGPFVWNTPATLGNGTHKVEVTAYDPHSTPGKTTIDVIIGPPCEKPADCPNDTDTCIAGRCVPGSGVPGGLGTACVENTECASGVCADDGTAKYCVEPCLIGQCPDGFGCLGTENATAEMDGVCWPGFDDGSGGCGCASNRSGPLGMMVLFGWVVLTCRRRRARS